MSGSNEIMTSTLFLGTYPGLASQMLRHVINVIATFANRSGRRE